MLLLDPRSVLPHARYLISPWRWCASVVVLTPPVVMVPQVCAGLSLLAGVRRQVTNP